MNQICTVFNDLSINDWSTLFQTISKSSFNSLASGKSFYEQILPSNTVQFGYTSTAIHWLSKKPCNLHNQCFVLSGQSTPEEIKMCKAQAAEDYKLFLQHRSNELKKGKLYSIPINTSLLLISLLNIYMYHVEHNLKEIFSCSFFQVLFFSV